MTDADVTVATERSGGAVPVRKVTSALRADIRRMMVAQFRALIEEIQEHRSLECRNLRDFTAVSDRHIVAVRMDASGDPEDVLALARLAASHSQPTTVFLDQRERYFRGSDGGYSPDLPDVLTALLVAGPELGLKCIPWMRGDPPGLDGGRILVEDVAWLRDQLVDLRGMAFDPPVHGVPAEGFELFAGATLSGRRSVVVDGEDIALGTLDARVLGLNYDSLFRVSTTPDTETIATYFAMAGQARMASASFQHIYWGPNPVFARDYTNTIILQPNGSWARYVCNYGDAAQYYPDIRALVRWIAGLPLAGHRFMFFIDPALLGE